MGTATVSLGSGSEPQSGPLAGRTALVTGASGGIGEAIVRDLASLGATVVLGYWSHGSAAARIAEELRSVGAVTHLVRADVSDAEAVAAMFRETLAAVSRLDILVNNAGITADRLLVMETDEEWQRVIDTNLGSVFRCSRAALRQMMKQRSGRIVNVASVIGQLGGVGQTNYAAAKAGVVGFTKACALEAAAYGVTVNAICPGYIETAMTEAMPAPVRERLLKRIPLSRFGRPDEVAACVRFLVVDGSYMTGQCLNLNGGLLMV